MRVDNWEVLGEDSACREAERQGVKPRLANPDVFAAALLTPTALPPSNFADLAGLIRCNVCQREFDFQAGLVLGAEMGGNARCPCGNTFTWLTAKEKRGSGLFFLVHPDVVPAHGSGGAVALKVTNLAIRPPKPGAAAPTKSEMRVPPSSGPHADLQPLMFRQTCAACGDDAWYFGETLLLVRTAGWELVEDIVVPATGAETTAADYDDRRHRCNAVGMLRPVLADAQAAALDDRKGFECPHVCGAYFCQGCLRGHALAHGRDGLACLECGGVVRRINDDSHQYSTGWGEHEQANVAEIAESVFDFAANRFKFPLIMTHALTGPLEKAADGSVVGGGWRELNEELRRNKASRQDALLVGVMPGKAFAGVSRSLRPRLKRGGDGYLRPVLLALALFEDYRLVDGGAGPESHRLEVSSRLGLCRNDLMACGYFLSTIVYRSIIDQFGGGRSVTPGSAVRELILAESEDAAAALIKKYATRYDFFVLQR